MTTCKNRRAKNVKAGDPGNAGANNHSEQAATSAEGAASAGIAARCQMPKAPHGLRIAELLYWISSISSGLAADRIGRLRRAAADRARVTDARLRACTTAEGIRAIREEVNSDQLAPGALASSPSRSLGAEETEQGAMERSLAAGQTPLITICKWVTAAEAQGVALTEWRWSNTNGATLLDKLVEAKGEIRKTCPPFDRVSRGVVQVAGEVWAASHYSAIRLILEEIIRLSESGDFEELGTWLSSIKLGSISAGIEWEAAQVATESAKRVVKELAPNARKPDGDVDGIGHKMVCEAWDDGRGYKPTWNDLAMATQKELAERGRALQIKTVATHLKQRAPRTKAKMNEVQAELALRKQASRVAQKKKTLPQEE